MTPPVYCILVNYNGWRDTIECLESLRSSDYPDLRVLVMDNGSSDQSLDRIAAWAAGAETAPAVPAAIRSLVHRPTDKPVPLIHVSGSDIAADAPSLPRLDAGDIALVALGENLGFSGANNAGLQYVSRMEDDAFAWLLNNDTVVATDALRQMVAAAGASDSGIGAVGATILRYREPALVETLGGGRVTQWHGMTTMLGEGMARTAAATRAPQALDFVSGCCFLIRQDALRRVGPLDQRYFIYAEDVDWGLRLNGAGLRQVHAPRAEIWHKGSTTMGQRSPWQDYHSVRSTLLLVQKHHPGMFPAALAYSVGRCLLPKIPRRQWGRLRAVLRAYGDVAMRLLRGTAATAARPVLLALLGAAAGCDPCSGIVNCTEAPRFAVVGRILDPVTGRPAVGTTVDLVRASGSALPADSLRSTVDENGTFEFQIPATADGSVTVNFVIRPASGLPFRVFGITLDATTRHGDAHVMEAWTTRPRFKDFADLLLRGAPPLPLPNKTVHFVRTGGIELVGAPDSIPLTTDSTGRLRLLWDVVPRDAGELIGNVIVPLDVGPSVVRDLRLPASAVYQPIPGFFQISAGPILPYHFEFIPRGKYGAHAESVFVHFQRTAGIPIDPDSFSVLTGPDGRAYFRPRPLGYGSVDVRMEVTPPAPWRSYTKDLTLDAVDADTAFLIQFGVGPGLPYYLRIHKNGAPVAGAQVRFRRTGGIVVHPSEFTAPTNDSGLVYLTPEPSIEGVVIAEIRVTPPPPYQPFTVTGLELTAIDDDVPGGRILAGDWNIAAPPSAMGRR